MITLLVPFFGKLPNYFPLILKSISYSKICELIIFTDDVEDYVVPENVHIVNMKFEEVKNIFNKKIGNVSLETPYKLCDYKPLYGLVFEKYIKNRFWGHCDLDVIFGDLDKYLIDVDYQRYERIFSLGHLTIYRNNLKMNNLYKYEGKSLPKMMNFDFVKKTTYPCYFDEIGMNHICKNNNIRFYDNFHSLNASYSHPKLAIYSIKNGVVVFDKGTLRVYDQNNNFKEYMYLHLQGMGLTPVHCNYMKDDFVIHEKGFFNFQGLDNLEGFRKDYSLVDINEYKYGKIKKRKSQMLDKLRFELRHFPIRAFYNIILRIWMQYYVKKNPLR